MYRLVISFMLAIGFVLALILFMGTTTSYSETQDPIDTECILASIVQPSYDIATDTTPLMTGNNAQIIELLTQDILPKSSDFTTQVAAPCTQPNHIKCGPNCCPPGKICCRGGGPPRCRPQGLGC
jgi:hypothetical protein